MSGWDGDKNDYLNKMRDGKMDVYSRRFHTDGCCPRCVFGPGSKYSPNEHAVWCVKGRETFGLLGFGMCEVKL